MRDLLDDEEPPRKKRKVQATPVSSSSDLDLEVLENNCYTPQSQPALSLADLAREARKKKGITSSAEDKRSVSIDPEEIDELASDVNESEIEEPPEGSTIPSPSKLRLPTRIRSKMLIARQNTRSALPTLFYPQRY